MTQRNQSLDVLRGVAVLMVIVSHYPYFHWMTAGWFGVDLFFVLSGFLISGLLFGELQQTGHIRIGRFLMRRGFKIYPSFYVFLAVTALMWPALRVHSWIEASFLQNYLFLRVTGSPEHGWAHLWSLAVEEHFYLLLPFLLLILVRSGRLNLIPRIAGWLCAACFVERIVVALSCPPQWIMMYRSHERIDALFAGVALSYIYRFRPESFARINRWWIALCALSMLSPALLFAHYQVLPGVLPLSGMLLLNLCGFALLLAWSVNRGIKFRPLEMVGRNSYSIYLWHTIPLVYLSSKPMTALGFLENIGMSLILGFSLARVIEFPALALRERITVLRNNRILKTNQAQEAMPHGCAISACKL